MGIMEMMMIEQIITYEGDSNHYLTSFFMNDLVEILIVYLRK